MCHEWWLQRRSQEREASRRLWDEFEHTRQLSDPEVTEAEAEVTLEQREPTAPSRRAASSMNLVGSRLHASGQPPRARTPMSRAPLLRLRGQTSESRSQEWTKTPSTCRYGSSSSSLV